MNPDHTIRRMFALPALTLAVLALVTGSQAATITKIATGTDLTLGASWGGTAPGSSDVAAWFSSTALGGALSLPTSVSWGGIGMTDASAGTTLSGAGTLTLGTSGIDMSYSARNLTLANAVALGASQTWSVASGKSLTASGGISGSSLTKAGAGSLTLSTAVDTFTGGLTVNNGTLTVDLSTLTTPTDLINSGNALTLGAATLTVKGKASAVSSQTFASTTLSANRGSVITLTQNSATSLTAVLGAITRNAGSTLNFSTSPNTTTVIATTPNGNETSGILGPWALLGTTAAPQYATVNASHQIVSYSGAATTAQPTNLSDVTGATTNYTFGATPSPTLTGVISANTLRFTGTTAGTLTNAGNSLTLNGLMNAGSAALTISGAGNLVIGPNQELVVVGNSQQTTISSTTHIVDNGAGASSLVYYSATPTAQLYISSTTNTYSGGTTCNGGDLHCQPAGAQMLGTGTVTINNGTLSSNAGQITHANTMVFNNATVSAGDNGIILNGAVTLYGNNTFKPVPYGSAKLDLTNTVSGSGGFTCTAGSASTSVILRGTDTYSGNTIITLGTVQLAATGSINNTPLISIGAGGTFDVSLKTSPYTLSTNTTLGAAGTTTAANLKGASGGTVSLGSQPVVLTYDGTHPALTVSQGTLALNGNAFTVNGSPLLAGAYNIVTETTGSISSSGTYPSATGTAIGTGLTGTISVSGQNVVLTVSSIKLAVSGFPGLQTAGTAGSVTIMAQDASGNTDTAYLGTVHFTSSDPTAVLPADYTFVPADHGTHTFTSSVTLKTVAGGTKSITATDSALSITASQSGITVTSAGAATLTVSGFPGSQTAGVAADVTVTAKDAYGNTATGYTGTVHFTCTDAAAAFPLDYTFVSGDNGIHTFTGGVTLNSVSPPTVAITASDTVTGTIIGTQSGITVTPATVASKLAVTGFPSSQTAGVADSLTVMAQAANGNLITTYTGTVHFTSSDPQAVLPTDYTFVPGDSGIHTFTSGVTLKTAGTQSITATDTVTAITGTQSGFTAGSAAATTLSVSGFPSPEWVGTAGSVTLTAHDTYGNIASSYTGIVHFTSSDLGAALPSDYSFVSTDNGVHNFVGGVTFAAAGTQSITATDIYTDTLTGTQSGITVNLVPSIFTWKTATSGSWSDVTNWTNDAGVVAGLDIAGKTNYTLNFTIAGTYTATHNLSQGFLLNQLNLTGATVAGNSLTFTNNSATPPQINQSTTASGTISNNISLASDTTVGVTGSGLTLNGVISGNGGLTKTGGGTLTISMANNYSGPTIISGGQLTMNQVSTALGTGPVTLDSGTTLWLEKVNVSNDLTLNGGTIIAGNGFGDSWNGAVTLNSNTTVNAAYAMSFGGIVSGAGGFIKTGPATLALSNANTFTGSMAVQAGALSVASMNSVSGGTPSSNLGAPTTVAMGTILLGSGATTATLYYHGTGETTDRVIDLAGTSGGATLEQAGTSGLLKRPRRHRCRCQNPHPARYHCGHGRIRRSHRG